MDGQTEGVGYRVASLRRLAGRTQERMAGTAHVSVSRVRAVEQGRTPASAAFTAAVAGSGAAGWRLTQGPMAGRG